MFISGRVDEIRYQEGEALAIGSQFIAETLVKYDGKQVNVVYGFSNKVIMPEDLLNSAIESANGEVDGEFYARYSELTGFLWVEEHALVGGHDLMKIFGSHKGKYGCLLIQTEPIELDDIRGEIIIEIHENRPQKKHRHRD